MSEPVFGDLILSMVKVLAPNQELEALIQGQVDEWFTSHPTEPRTRWKEFIVGHAVFLHLENLAATAGKRRAA